MKTVRKILKFLVKTLEVLINEIKVRGFEKCKFEMDQKLKYRSQLEVSVENLQKKVNFLNSQKKHYGHNNSKIESEIILFKNLSERWNRETFFMGKELPGIKQEIQQV
jgi:hypothetical protein